MPTRPRPSALGQLEDRRQIRRVRLVRGLFVLGLVTWTTLAAWWATYFYRSDQQVRVATLRAYASEERLLAQGVCLSGTWKGGDRIGMTPFALAAPPLDAETLEFPAFRAAGCDLMVVVAPEERARLRTEAHRKLVMLAGEGTLLVGLLFACLVGLYRLLDGEWRLNRQTESFVHAVTHELRSPLAGLRALLQSFETLEMPRAERREYVALGLREIARLDQLVSNVLLSSRLDAEAYAAKLEDVDVHAALARARERKLLVASEQGGRIELAPGSARARVDPEALDVILENLVDNAIKYSQGAPSVVLAARVEGRKCLVSVVDSGIGIEKRDLARVFEKFYRAPDGAVREAKGSGLGLSIARQLARACGGEIRAKSDGRGKGTAFTLELPG